MMTLGGCSAIHRRAIGGWQPTSAAPEYVAGQSREAEPLFHALTDPRHGRRSQLSGPRRERDFTALAVVLNVLDEEIHLGDLAHLAFDDLVGEVAHSRVGDGGPSVRC